MEQKQMVELIARLRDMDKTNEFKDKFDFFMRLYESGDEKVHKLLETDFNLLAKGIANELELMKKEF